MKTPLTVDKAITRGLLVINPPVMLIMLGIPGITLYLSAEKSMPNWSIVISFLLGFGLAWTYWSFAITKWRIWAFENVRNVHELKKSAIENGLIWTDTKWFNKTEIKSEADKLKWKLLLKKFEKEDDYFEDCSLPIRTRVYFSKFKSTYNFILMLICLFTGLFLLLKSDSYIIGTGLSLVGAYLAYKELKPLLNNAAQLIIDNKGIETTASNFKSWAEIKHEEVIMEGAGKTTRFYLIYTYNNGSEKLLLDDFNMSPKDIETALRTYRIRYNKYVR
ncbi:hypothetical protein ACJOV8_011635 [Formosa sp. 3Alg 14/1]|uniref:hypothetical protein n=1 Tax=Formosa sp. 3Alg 14/1 TaxID=3382190 RepID=UPI0039BEBBF9